jgi:hypothetical protein
VTIVICKKPLCASQYRTDHKQIKHNKAEAYCDMSYKGTNIHRLYEQIRSIVHHSNQDEGMYVKVLEDLECGVIKIYDQNTDSLKRAISGLYDVLELSYATAEHHPYWTMLYNATEILKTILDKWGSDFCKDEIDDMVWRVDELRMVLNKVKSI